MMNSRTAEARVIAIALLIVWAGVGATSLAQVAPTSIRHPQPLFKSEVIRSETAGHAIAVDVDIRNLTKLYLVADDAGNGFSHDWADWVNARLVGPSGEKWLSDLKPLVSTSGFGDVHMNRNCQGEPLRIAGQSYDRGLGTHANSVIGFELPPGFERFQATAGLDEGGTRQAGGANASVRFQVFAEAPRIIGGDFERHDPSLAIEKLDVAAGVQATLFDSEPNLLSLTNLDVDAQGRVWVCEVVNYRGHNGERPDGDRILICTDKNGDGVSDETRVYYQGRDVDSAMGLCVLGNKVIVSCSPNIWIFTDDDGDDRPDRKELLFSKTGSSQHDHSAHSFVFGPDGKLYWNFGNEGHAVHDASGNRIVDRQGNEVSDRGLPYRGGMVFRCNLDGSEMEVLGHNFRNNYEVAVDSFGGLWQSDNDDDGNRSVRLNFVMEFGNFGYLDELTGASWQKPRTGMETEIPRRHWHQDDPGVVPNLLITGAGSPTGITVYEGDLLPLPFRNQILHCDAGPNVVRSYQVEPSGAGYEVTQTNNLVLGDRDPWFRPADVCAAPDGSIFVSDWHDPGVGGHGMQDVSRGRLFRIAPPDCRYEIPRYDFNDANSAVQALRNPAQSVRFLAWHALKQLGSSAENALQKLAADPLPQFRARAFWLLREIEGRHELTVTQAAADVDERIRAQAVRMARRKPETLGLWINQLQRDSAPSVRREVAIALHEYQGPDANAIWTELALQYDGHDRWYLESLGIGAAGHWDERLQTLETTLREKTPPARINLDLLCRSRGAQSASLIASYFLEDDLDSKTGIQLVRALDLQDPQKSEKAIRELANSAERRLEESQSLSDWVVVDLACRVSNFATQSLPLLRKQAVQCLLNRTPEEEFVVRADQLRLPELSSRLMQIVQRNSPRNQVGQACRILLDLGTKKELVQTLTTPDEPLQLAAVQALKSSGHPAACDILIDEFDSTELSTIVRSEIIKALGGWQKGQRFVLDQVTQNQLQDELKFPAANILLTSNDAQIREQASQYLSMPMSAANVPIPPMAELVGKRGDPVRGQGYYQEVGTCAKCHKVNGAGTEVGPDLSEIGSKLSTEALYESILNPSAGISHNYEMYSVLTVDGRTLTGILISQTNQTVVLKDKDATFQTIPRTEIDELKRQTKSLMPEDLHKQLTEQQLIDIVEYLFSLKKQ